MSDNKVDLILSYLVLIHASNKPKTFIDKKKKMERFSLQECFITKFEKKKKPKEKIENKEPDMEFYIEGEEIKRLTKA